MCRCGATRWAALAGLWVFASGCSLLFVNGPPQGHEQLAYFPCTESNAVPILDGIGAGLSVLGVITAEDDPPGELYRWERETYVAVNLSAAALLGLSTWVGSRRVRACRAARLELAKRTQEQNASAEPPKSFPLPLSRPPYRSAGARDSRGVPIDDASGTATSRR